MYTDATNESAAPTAQRGKNATTRRAAYAANCRGTPAVEPLIR